MSEFELYLRIGLGHILDVHAYDHILFVVAIAALYEISEWKKVLILITAFTIGHSITLALATLKIITINSALIEFLIPTTIVITAISNLIQKRDQTPKKISLNYFYALGFGLIHGMGFSNYLRSLLGKEESILTPLFAFNIGLEIGQIIIVGIFLVLSFLFVSVIHVSKRDWKMIVSAAVMGVGITLMLDAVYW